MTIDHQLRQDVLAELEWEPSIAADHIGVTAENGVVTLSGHVESYWQKKAAESAAGRVKGLKALAEEIEVRLPGNVKRGDDQIARAALERMGWDITLPQNAVKVQVEKGYVTLTGEVDWTYQKESAVAGLRSLMGITGVTNEITVKPHVSTFGIRDHIRHALDRGWHSYDKVEVTVDGGCVHLTGTVESWGERDVAARVAWAAKGTTSVQNEILIA